MMPVTGSGRLSIHRVNSMWWSLDDDIAAQIDRLAHTPTPSCVAFRRAFHVRLTHELRLFGRVVVHRPSRKMPVCPSCFGVVGSQRAEASYPKWYVSDYEVRSVKISTSPCSWCQYDWKAAKRRRLLDERLAQARQADRQARQAMLRDHEALLA